MTYKYKYKKVLQKIDDKMYKIDITAEDYYTEDALKNIVKTHQQKLEYCNEKINSMAIKKTFDMVLHTMLMPYLGSITVIKLMKKNNIEIHPDYYDKLSEEDIKLTDEPVTEEEQANYDKMKPMVIQMLEQDLMQSRKDKKEIEDTLPLWTEALEKGHSESYIERDI